MKKQISRISPHQSAKVIGGLYLLVTSPACLIGIFLFFGSLIVKQNILQSLPFLFFVFVPLIYGFLGYLGFGLLAIAYNFIAKYIGGIEFEVNDLPEA
jgi:hypothetical protein